MSKVTPGKAGDALKPCPFCGDHMQPRFDGREIRHPYRGECPLGAIVFYTTDADAWNTHGGSNEG